MNRIATSLVASLIFTAVAPVVTAEQAPPKVTIEHKFTTSADIAWKELGWFCSISEWQSLVSSCVTEERKDGIYRTVVMNNNSVFVERLENYSSNDRAFSYTIKSGPLPITDYRSELRFVPAGDKETTLIWRAWYSVPAGAEEEAIANNLKQLFSNGIKGMTSVLSTAH